VRYKPLPGLPDGIFLNQKYKFWVNFEGSCKGRCWYILCPFGIPTYFTVIWCILLPFGIFYGYLVYFSPFGML
jgi:hypothetical protein